MALFGLRSLNLYGLTKEVGMRDASMGRELN